MFHGGGHWLILIIKIKKFAEKCIGIYEHHTLVENNTFYKAIATNILIVDKYFIIDSGNSEYILYPKHGEKVIKNFFIHFNNILLQIH